MLELNEREPDTLFDDDEVTWLEIFVAFMVYMAVPALIGVLAAASLLIGGQ